MSGENPKFAAVWETSNQCLRHASTVNNEGRKDEERREERHLMRRNYTEVYSRCKTNRKAEAGEGSKMDGEGQRRKRQRKDRDGEWTQKTRL